MTETLWSTSLLARVPWLVHVVPSGQAHMQPGLVGFHWCLRAQIQKFWGIQVLSTMAVMGTGKIPQHSTAGPNHGKVGVSPSWVALHLTKQKFKNFKLKVEIYIIFS